MATLQRRLDHSRKAQPVAPRSRSDTKNSDDPRGQFGEFLRHWVDTKAGGQYGDLAENLGVSPRAVGKWMEGAAGPSFGDLDRVAVALGYDDWVDLAIAVRKFHRR